MAKKVSYNGKPYAELQTELAKLRLSLRDATMQMMQGKGMKDYRMTRKSIARILTAMNDSTKL